MVLINLILLLSLTSLLPQQVQDTFYVESWKKGKQQITGQTFDIQLNSAKPKFEAKIKDPSGKDKYKLTLWLKEERDKARPPHGYVELVEKGLVGYKDTNLLKPSNDPNQDYFTGADFVAVLDPGIRGDHCALSDRCAPFLAKRVVRVAGFYCVVQVVRYNESPASMAVRVEFTNKAEGSFTAPRT